MAVNSIPESMPICTNGNGAGRLRCRDVNIVITDHDELGRQTIKVIGNQV
jgi:hypothetical protein